ncbi:hypothetical protein ACFO3D_13980 [Virgibacillus kekensis]|uniref:Uncharacterized protein n=1 Tax=Virgibacillus kekensis TaxID=202261 RepID=A0ABV9DKF4_9BACI
MTVLVENCFDWLGYHILEELLENDYETAGVDEITTDFKEHLSMLVGRNALFRHITEPERENKYDSSIVVKSDQLIITRDGQQTTVELPLLFGEWMPMNEAGIYRQNNHIPFDSNFFQKNAVYVDDFVRSLLLWMKASQLPGVLEVKSATDDKEVNIKLENSVYIRNNIPINELVGLVKNHYNKYRNIYQCH